MPYETYTPLFHEICTKVNNAKDKPAKIKVLRQYRTAALEMFFKSALCPEVEWMLPEGDVPFIPNEAPEGTEHTLLSASMNKVHNYVRLNRNKRNLEPVVGNPDLNSMKREMMFIQLLEGLQRFEPTLLHNVARCAKDTWIRNWQRNETLIDLSKIPEDISINIVEEYDSVLTAKRSELFNYFVEKKLTDLIDRLGEY